MRQEPRIHVSHRSRPAERAYRRTENQLARSDVVVLSSSPVAPIIFCFLGRRMERSTMTPPHEAGGKRQEERGKGVRGEAEAWKAG